VYFNFNINKEVDMKKIKQYLLQRRCFMILVTQIFIIYQLIITFDKITTTDFYSFFIIFIYISLILIGLSFMFVFSLTPYIEKIAKDINVKESIINLPKLYSFANSLEFTISIPESKNTSYLLEGRDKSSFLDLNKFDIKLFDKDKNEIAIDIYPSLSKHQQINIRLKNNKDIIKSKMLFIKIEKEINLSIDYMSFNRK